MTSASAPRTDRVLGAYLGLALGDALGASVEFMTPREIAEKHGVHDAIVGGGWLHLKRGQVTDDTEMALALGDAILERGGRVEARAVAESFSTWMSSKPVDIGNTVRRGIMRYRTHGEVEMAENEFDGGNGACMRCLPVAVATLEQGEEEVREASRIQAHVTHNNPLSDAGTETVTLMLRAALKGQGGREVLFSHAHELVEAHPRFRFLGRKRRAENPGGFIVDTLRVVFESLFGTEAFDAGGFEACLVDVVNRGGDADTTGAIAGMILGAVHGAETLPARWLRRLDKTVRRRCEIQAAALTGLTGHADVPPGHYPWSPHAGRTIPAAAR